MSLPFLHVLQSLCGLASYEEEKARFVYVCECSNGKKVIKWVGQSIYCICGVFRKTLFNQTNTNTVEPRNNSPAFEGSPSIKVNILRSQMMVFKVNLGS